MTKPTGRKPTGRPPVPIEVRFWKFVDQKSIEDCWPWIGGKSPDGYGKIQDKDKGTLRANRVAYEIHYGEIPAGLAVLHKCDNPLCVNPNHLFLGTFGENSADMVRKNRQASGTRNGRSKLTEENVREIKALYKEGVFQPELSRRFGIAQTIISQIIRGERWDHVQ